MGRVMEQTVIPQSLVDLLCNKKPDRLSSTWREMFRSILNTVLQHQQEGHIRKSLFNSVLSINDITQYLYFNQYYAAFLAKSGLSCSTIQSYCAAFLAKSGLSCSTIQSYLSALRYLHISCGLPEPDVSEMAKLKLVVRGIRRLKAKDFDGRRRLPITPSILTKLRR